MKLSGYSIFEVLISMIIVLVMAMLFLIVVSRIIDSQPRKSEAKWLYYFDSLTSQVEQEEGTEMVMYKLPPYVLKETVKYDSEGVLKMKVTITDSGNSAAFAIYKYCLPSPNTMFYRR